MPEEKDLSRDELITLYASLPERLAAAVNGLSDDQLNLTGGPDEWSVRQIIHHLADGQAVWSL
jgi:uncharacterized damage-inducible protein DinB